MRKVFAILIGVCLIGTIGMLIAGCGQQTPTIGTSQPAGLKIKGVVYTTTLSGTKGDPVSGAGVALSGDSADFTSVTDSNGEYVISGIPDGSYLLTVTAEGHKRSTGNTVTIKPSSDVPADNTITVKDIQLSSNPVILGYSPAPNSVVSQTPTFVVTFNETMETSTVIPSLAPSGIRTFAISGGTVPLSASWSSDNVTLTITPEASLGSNEAYVLNINPETTVKDAAGYTLSTSGDQALASSQTYRIATGGVPAAPSGIIVTTVTGSRIFTTDEAATGADYSHVYGGNLNLYWDSPSSGLVTGYKVYTAIEGASAGNYVLVATVTTNNTTVTSANLITALFGAGSTVNPVSTINYPLINKTLYFKVIAYNGDGESSAASWSGKETVGPQVDATAFDGLMGNAAEVLNNNYYLPALTAGTDTKIAYIAFNQPIDAATVTATNFSLSAGTVTGAALLTSSSANLTASFTGNVFSIVKITSDTDFVGGETLTVGTGVKDLAGNPVVAGTGDTVVLP